METNQTGNDNVRLIILDPNDGTVITEDGRMACMRDPTGQLQPLLKDWFDPTKPCVMRYVSSFARAVAECRERGREGVLSVWWFNDDISIFMVHTVFCLVSFWSQYFSLKCQHKKNTFVWYCCSPSAVGKWLLGVPWKWKNGHHIDVLVKVWLLSTFLRNSLSKHPDFSEILPPLEPTIEKLHPSGRRKIPMETSFFQGFVWKFGNGVEEETQ